MERSSIDWDFFLLDHALFYFIRYYSISFIFKFKYWSIWIHVKFGTGAMDCESMSSIYLK